VIGVLGYTRLRSGNVAAGAELLQEAATIAQATGAATHSALLLARVAEAYLLAGARDTAGFLASRALAVARERGQCAGEGWALAVLGDVEADADASGDADPRERFQDALAIATALGMRPLAAHCHLGLGETDRRAGKLARAREHLAAAHSMFHAMGMPIGFARAARELRGVS
jgi:hypothetical protein